jgi:teichuronic acid biosynthesis glycosyltransferase TuaC
LARVLFITTSFPAHPGDPSGHFVETEARLRGHAGDSVVVVAPWTPSVQAHRPRRVAATACDATSQRDDITVEWVPAGDAFGWPGVLARLREKPLRAVAAARFVFAARRAARRLGPFDEVVAHWLVPAAWPIAAAASGTLEIVAHGSDVKLVERLPRAARVVLAGALLSRGARFRFVSEDLRTRFVRATTSAVLARSRVEPCAIDVSFAPPRAEARTRLGIADERVGVVVGRLVASKDPLLAVRLAEGVTDRVVVVGDGPLLESVRRACPRATLVGKLPRPETLAWISAADLLVSASRAEGASTVVREARALGTPVLAVPAGDIAELALGDAGITLVPRVHRLPRV